MGKDVIIACDFSDKATCLDFLDEFPPNMKPYVKIGMELYHGQGPEIVRELKKRGHKVFLDLKLHDIPNTVEQAMAVLAGYQVDMCNVHASGGITMMKAALRGLHSVPGVKPKLIAVTQLTSTSQAMLESELLIEKPMDQVVSHYAMCTKNAGLDGIVCSPLEAGIVKKNCGASFLTVTPGIRFSDDSVGDQVRVTTPRKARELGSDYIVVGRPITESQTPAAVYRQCMQDFTA